jgi:hypothetical protein
MGILYFAAMFFWFTYLFFALCLAGGFCWLAVRLWRRATVSSVSAAPVIWRRCLAGALGLVAFGPLVWVLLNPPTFRPDLRRIPLQPGANLERYYLEGIDLRGRKLSRANLQRANLMGSDLRGVDLRHADLRGAYLHGANLGQADLRGAHLDGTELSGAFYDAATRWPQSFDPQRHGLVQSEPAGEDGG